MGGNSSSEKPVGDSESIQALHDYIETGAVPTWGFLPFEPVHVTFFMSHNPELMECTVPVRLFWNGLGLKSQLFLRDDVGMPLPPPKSFRLLFASQDLDDLLPLQSQGICGGAEIEIVFVPEESIDRATLAESCRAQGPFLEEALWEADADAARLHILAGANVNSATTLGRTRIGSLLHIAVQRGSLECFMLLIRAGADINILYSPKSGTTVLHMAAFGSDNQCTLGHLKIAIQLLMMGMNPNQKALNGKSPIDLATHQANIVKQQNRKAYCMMQQILEASRSGRV